jgi:hypothetical protein
MRPQLYDFVEESDYDLVEHELIEQLRDIWTGRKTYEDDEEWLSNLKEIVTEIIKVCYLKS